ncbi:MAG TPA: type II toxin-antitoxin system HicB family antitoxin [Micropepsaceae bacterium]|nr:type II toxin-antitoxin system HicB family antitoxin [Micropepsaceae bacterium]HRK71086.1 type II toxin-antitoxin system HicB family antitoxin [Micropepsaceae bacterium]
MKQLEHKGYTGTAELSVEDGVFAGKIAFIRDLVTFESSTAAGLVRAFKEAVDDYLEDCRKSGRSPDRPFKGQFNVRTSPKIHRAYAMMAAERGVSFNEAVAGALEAGVAAQTRRKPSNSARRS